MNVDALERLELMRRRLDTDGRIRVADLAIELDVSEMTIRRDLDLLVDEGIAARVRGGAVAVGPQEFEARFRQHARAKARIAEKLLDLVGAGGAIGIDASSTMRRCRSRRRFPPGRAASRRCGPWRVHAGGTARRTPAVRRRPRHRGREWRCPRRPGDRGRAGSSSR